MDSERIGLGYILSRGYTPISSVTIFLVLAQELRVLRAHLELLAHQVRQALPSPLLAQVSQVLQELQALQELLAPLSPLLVSASPVIDCSQSA